MVVDEEFRERVKNFIDRYHPALTALADDVDVVESMYAHHNATERTKKECWNIFWRTGPEFSVTKGMRYNRKSGKFEMDTYLAPNKNHNHGTRVYSASAMYKKITALQADPTVEYIKVVHHVPEFEWERTPS